MAWEEIAPRGRPGPSVLESAAIMRCLTPSGRRNSYITLTLRRDAVEWFAPGSTVSVCTGNGPHEGKILVKPGGPFTVWPIPGAKKQAKNPSIRVPLFSWLKPGSRPATAVAYAVEDDAMTVDLPDWAARQKPRVGAKPPEGQGPNKWRPPGSFRLGESPIAC